MSAFAQVGVHSRLVDRTNIDDRVTYTDPTTARLVVADFGEIPLATEHQAAQAETWQLKISELISGHQSQRALQLHRELETITAALAPPPEPTLSYTPDSPTGKPEEPAAAVPLHVPPPAAERLPARPLPTRPQPRPSLLPAPALRSAELVRHPLPTHSQMAATKSYRGAATPR